MNLLYRAFTLILLVVALTSCSTKKATSAETPLSPTSSWPSSVAQLRPTSNPSPSPPQTTPVSVTITPTTVVMENGLIWIECIVPNRNYSRMVEDMAILKKCVDPFEGSNEDVIRHGERMGGDLGFDDLRITLGTDHFEAKLIERNKDGFHYELTRNGEAFFQTITHFTTYDPNQNLWSIDGKLVWELGGSQPVIIVDGVNFNQHYQLDGSYFPYEIKGKLIFVAKKNEKFMIVYDEKIIGPEFDEISMPYCCGMVPLIRENGQYWFVGSREGIKYLVSIQ